MSWNVKCHEMSNVVKCQRGTRVSPRYPVTLRRDHTTSPAPHGLPNPTLVWTNESTVACSVVSNVSSTRMRFSMKLRSTNGENKARLGSRSLGTLFQFFEGFTEWASWCETIDAMGQLHCLLAGTESDQQLEKLILYGNPELIVFRLQINKYQNSIVLFGPHYCRVQLPYMYKV